MKHSFLFFVVFIFVISLSSCGLYAQQVDLLIKNGHVIDPKNGINSKMDVAVTDGVISHVANNISIAGAEKVVDATGYYVTPGLIDVHAHVFVGMTPRKFAGGLSSVFPDDHSFRSGVTTVVDPGNAGWRNFPFFKEQVIDQSETRVLAFINIVGHGLSGNTYNFDLDDMDIEKTLSVVEAYPEIIVGTKFGHFRGDYREPFKRAREVALRADQPLLLECNLPELDVEEVLMEMRPGDIFTHAFEAGRRSLLDDHNRIHEYVIEARERGIRFDVGHGGGSFRFSQAIPSVEQGFLPYTFGTDLHHNSRNAGMKDMLNIMSKFLNMGMKVEDIILGATWNAARSIKREDLGHLSEGAIADLTILRKNQGSYGFVDARGFRMNGDQKFEAELTLREGRVVWDLNGLASPHWNEFE